MLIKKRVKTYFDVVLALFLFLVVSYSYSQQGAELIAYAKDIKITNPEEAIRISENVLLRMDDREPQNYEVYLVLIEASIYLERYDKAIGYIFKLRNFDLPVDVQFEVTLLEARVYHILRLKNYESKALEKIYSLLELVENSSLKKKMEWKLALQNKSLQVFDESLNKVFTKAPPMPINSIGEDGELSSYFYLDYLFLEGIASINSNEKYDFQNGMNKVPVDFNTDFEKLYYENFSLIDAQYYSLENDHAIAIQILEDTLDYLAPSEAFLYYRSQIIEALINSFIEVKDKASVLKARKISDNLEGQILEIETSVINKLFEYKSERGKEEVIQLVNNQKRITDTVMAISIVSFFIAAVFWFRFYWQHKQYNEVQHYLNKLEEKPKKIETKLKVKTKPSNKISDELEAQIIKGLEDFEKKKEYLNNNVSLAYLASKLEVNTKYLSGFLNSQLNESFSTYINRLRIEYIVGKLQSDPKYLKYKISYLAEEAGYSSHSSFTIAFKAVTGMAPTKFISYLKK